MGLFDDILGTAMRSALGSAEQQMLPDLLGKLLGQTNLGSIGGLLQQLQQGGLADQVNSWVSTGSNQPVNPQQLEQALGPEAIAELQQQTGIPRDQLMSELAQHLPEAVSEATPQGRLPDTDDELHETVTTPPVAH